jgi:hypothetical protein
MNFTFHTKHSRNTNNDQHQNPLNKNNRLHISKWIKDKKTNEKNLGKRRHDGRESIKVQQTCQNG